MSAVLFVARAVPGDATALAALAGECFSQPWSERQFADELALAPPNAVLAVRARVAGAPVSVPVAFCAYRLVIDELHLLDVAVAPSERRRGLARRMLVLALRAGARAGARRALLEARAGNAEALALYAALGFREAGRRRGYYRDPVEDALLLERTGLAGLS